jgi:molybdopterin-guanine dinucleotide biosynthesis protein A
VKAAITRTDSALILAGGKGARIGYDKKELVLDGVRVIDKLIGALRTSFDQLIVSSNTPFEREGVVTVHDELGAGPLAGIFSALKVCTSEYLYVTACDMPFISLEYIEKLKEIILQHDVEAVVTRRKDGFLEPFNAFYKASCADTIREQLAAGEYKIGYLLKKLNLHIIDAVSEDMFFNINYREDLDDAQLRRMMGG